MKKDNMSKKEVINIINEVDALHNDKELLLNDIENLKKKKKQQVIAIGSEISKETNILKSVAKEKDILLSDLDKIKTESQSVIDFDTNETKLIKEEAQRKLSEVKDKVIMLTRESKKIEDAANENKKLVNKERADNLSLKLSLKSKEDELVNRKKELDKDRKSLELTEKRLILRDSRLTLKNTELTDWASQIELSNKILKTQTINIKKEIEAGMKIKAENDTRLKNIDKLKDEYNKRIEETILKNVSIDSTKTKLDNEIKETLKERATYSGLYNELDVREVQLDIREKNLRNEKRGLDDRERELRDWEKEVKKKLKEDK